MRKITGKNLALTWLAPTVLASSFERRDASVDTKVYAPASVRLAESATGVEDIDESRTVFVVASTESLDGHGTVVKQNWDLERYLKNPVVLYSHNSWGQPIGRATRVEVENGRLVADIELAPAELSSEAEQVRKLIKGGFLKGVSVGFRPRSVRWEVEDDREYLVLDDNELLEISLTAVPSNPETLAEMRSMATASRTAKPDSPPVKAGITPPGELTMTIKKLARRLGLEEDAGEATIMRAFDERMQEGDNAIAFRSVVCDLTGCDADASQGALVAWKKSHGELPTVRDELEALKATETKREFAALIDKGIKAGQLAGPTEDWARSLEEKPHGLEVLRGYLETAAPVVPSAHKSARQAEPDGSESDSEFAKRHGVSLSEARVYRECVENKDSSVVTARKLAAARKGAN